MVTVDTLDRMVLLVYLDFQVTVVHKVYKVYQVCQAILASLDCQVILDIQGQESQVGQDGVVSQAILDLVVFQDIVVIVVQE